MQDTEEPEGGMADAPVEALLKEIVKGIKRPQAAPIIVEAGPSGIKVDPATSGITPFVFHLEKIHNHLH